jgi:GDP-4-dehydro-6-deoxy-D-mannose reductase
LGEVAPDVIFHLAALAKVGGSWDNPWPVLHNNIRGQLNILEALLHLGAAPRLMVVGSNEEYGLVRPGELPLTEASPLRPNSPYGVSKVTQDMLGLQYHLSHDLPIIRIRPFNHIGPRQSPGVRAYHLAAVRGAPGEVYNIGSGQAHSIQELLDTLLSYSYVEISVKTDPTRLRPSDVPTVRCDASKFRALTGWAPEIPFTTSLSDVLDDWRRRVQKE